MALKLLVNNLPGVLRNEAGQIVFYRCGRCGQWVEVEVFTDKAATTTGLSVVATMVEHTAACAGVRERQLPLAERIQRHWKEKL